MQDKAQKELEAQKFRKAALKHLESQGQRVSVNGKMMGSTVENKQIDNTLQLLLRQSVSEKKKQEVERKGLMSSRSALATDKSDTTSTVTAPSSSNVAATNAKLAPLPACWKAVSDEGTGKTYYWNTETNETSWDRPASNPPQSAVPASSASAISTPILPPGWEERVHPATKQVYYFHAASKQTSHTLPPMPSAASQAATIDSAAGNTMSSSDNAKKRKIGDIER